MVSIPPDSGGTITSINDHAERRHRLLPLLIRPIIPVIFDLFQEVITTNDNGNELEVLSNLNNTIGPWYRY